MAKLTYIALLEAAKEGIGVTFPDLPGCTSWGEDEGRAYRNAHDALSLHLEGLAEAGQGTPAPSGMVQISKDVARRYSPGKAPLMLAAVTVEGPDSAERVNIYLAKSLLQRIDSLCREEEVNRSAFFVQAARMYLGIKRPETTRLTPAQRRRRIQELTEKLPS